MQPPSQDQDQPEAHTAQDAPLPVGIWRAGPQAQRRDVAVEVAAGAVILRDPRDSSVLAHWASDAVCRINAGHRPALFAPQDDDEGEVLEIGDPLLAGRIDAVCATSRARRAHPGRLRLITLAAVCLLLAAALGLWFPRALVSHTASLVPPAKRAEIGRAALLDVARLTGSPCAGPEGVRALSQLSRRLFATTPTRIVILREGLSAVGGAAHLPGRIILLDRALLEDFDTPEIVAGHALAEALRAEAQDPLPPLLREAGLAATARLLTTGALPPGALEGSGTRVLTTPPAALDAATLADRFRAAGVRAGPYAAQQADRALHDALLAETLARTVQPRLLLPDADWVALRGICDD